MDVLQCIPSRLQWGSKFSWKRHTGKGQSEAFGQRKRSSNGQKLKTEEYVKSLDIRRTKLDLPNQHFSYRIIGGNSINVHRDALTVQEDFLADSRIKSSCGVELQRRDDQCRCFRRYSIVGDVVWEGTLKFVGNYVRRFSDENQTYKIV